MPIVPGDWAYSQVPPGLPCIGCANAMAYGEFLREEVAQTLEHPEAVDEELRHLLSALVG